jgi:diaminopimelate decarboxylase
MGAGGVEYHEGALACDGLPLRAIALEHGTPVHVYSAAAIAERFAAFDAPFAGVPHRVHYALKANSTLALVAWLRELGASADANSGGEIALARRAGFQPADIVFTGVGKTPAELELAVGLGVGAINVESAGEIGRLSAIAVGAGRDARVAVRVNPDIDAGTHPHIATGSRVNKFGVSAGAARELARDAARRPGLRLVGLHVHVGSQITRAEPLARAAPRSPRSRAICGPKDCLSSIWISAAGSASVTARISRRSRRANTPRRFCRPSGRRGSRSCSSRAAGSSGPPACW